MEGLDENITRLVQHIMEEESKSDDNANFAALVFGSTLAMDRARGSYSRAPNLNREREVGHDRLMKDYFNPSPVFPESYFRRRFRMNPHVFRRVEEAMGANNEYFIQKRDAIGVLGLSSKKKVTAVVRMLAYGCSADSLDEYLRIGESTTMRCLDEFCETMISVFGREYLRSPTSNDTARILAYSAERGFRGMIGSIDCMHWDWKNCPTGWAGQYQDRHGHKSIILEAVATYDLHIWHSYFGSPGSKNDLNVLDRSPLFYDLLRGKSPKAQFIVNGVLFEHTYYLAHGIYPEWATFVKTISDPLNEKATYFAMQQEAARKDIERAFGVLRQRWGILRYPSRLWHIKSLKNIMQTCIILHNLVVEDEGSAVMECRQWPELQVEDRSSTRPLADWRDQHVQYVGNTNAMTNSHVHKLLKRQLVEHVYRQKLVNRMERRM